jgi:hypothetical protein
MCHVTVAGLVEAAHLQVKKNSNAFWRFFLFAPHHGSGTVRERFGNGSGNVLCHTAYALPPPRQCLCVVKCAPSRYQVLAGAFWLEYFGWSPLMVVLWCSVLVVIPWCHSPVHLGSVSIHNYSSAAVLTIARANYSTCEL